MNTDLPHCLPNVPGAANLMNPVRFDVVGGLGATAEVAVVRLSLNPVAWKAPTAGVRRRGGRYFAGTSPVPELVAYQQAIREMSEQHWTKLGLSPLGCEVHIDWVFRRQLPSYTSASGRTVTKHRQDLTNLVKAAEDALQPHVIINDNQVVSMSARFDGPQSKDTNDPYVEFTVRWPCSS